MVRPALPADGAPNLGAALRNGIFEVSDAADAAKTAADAKAQFANSVKFILKVGGVWPTSYDANGDPVYTGGTASTGVRPSSSTRTLVMWIGAEPFPPIITSGAAGRYAHDLLFIG